MDIKNVFFALIMVFFSPGCNKDDPEPPEPYMKSLISPESNPNYYGNYYIHVSFSDMITSISEERTFSNVNQSMAVSQQPFNSGFNMSSQVVHFFDSASHETLDISFLFNNTTDSTFVISYADYYYSNPWIRSAGANCEYFVPISSSDPSKQYRYMGRNYTDSYFRITYIGENRINGSFRTVWKDCCGESKTFNVVGVFSIPDIRYPKEN